MQLEAASTFAQAFELSRSTLGTLQQWQLPVNASIHKVYFHARPSDTATTYLAEIAVEFRLDGKLVARLPANITGNPVALVASLFPASSNALAIGAQAISIAYPGGTDAYILHPRSVIARADEIHLTMTKRTGTAGIHYYLAVHSASLPF